MGGEILDLSGRAVPALSNPDLEAGLQAAAEFARRALAKTTMDAYRRAWAGFEVWCIERGEPCALPCRTEVVAAFLAEKAAAGISHRRLAVIRAAIRKQHLLRGFPDPTDDERIRVVVKGIRNVQGTAPKARKAAILALPRRPGEQSDLDRILGRIPPTLLGLRDRAILLVAYAGALRRSELTALTVADIEEVDGGLHLTIRRSKGDQAGKGQRVGVPFGARHCPVKALRAWLAAARIVAGPLFRYVDVRGKIHDAPLSTNAIASVVKRRAQAAGLDPAKFSAHSLRRGLLTSAARNGASVWKLKAASRHKDIRTLQEYVEEAGVLDEHIGAGLL